MTGKRFCGTCVFVRPLGLAGEINSVPHKLAARPTANLLHLLTIWVAAEAGFADAERMI